MSSTDFFPSKTWFFGEFIWIFCGRNHFKINISHKSESKSYQINSIKSCSSRAFQEHQRHIPIPLKFSATINLIFSEEIIQYSRTSTPQVQTPWNQPSWWCTPPPCQLSKEIQNSIWSIPGSVDLIGTKQTNYRAS